jgi:hypothetical protein
MTEEIRIIKGSLDETEIVGRGKQIILRGVIDATTLNNLRTDKYQREAQPVSSLRSIIRGLEDGNALPDIELAMRGTKVSTKGEDTYILRDDVFIVDGLQRVTAANYYLAQNPDANVRLGATIHFGTTEEWERERFRILNSDRIKVAASVILRNLRHDNRSVLTLFGLSTNDRDFVLYRRVCWEQNMTRNDLITGIMMAKAAGRLHMHGGSSGGATQVNLIVPQLERIADKITLPIFRENVKAYYDLIEAAFGIRSIQYRAASPQMREAFLTTFARLLSDHVDFWRGKDGRELYIPRELRLKIGSFPINDPSVAYKCAAGGAARNELYALLVNHINSGKRTHRLTPREATSVYDESPPEKAVNLAMEAA